ncbi:alpha/beta fold hydrolase [Cupriavidus sp. SZY C1]|uniref:bifunctional alpha/beta hydrolase/OsmC family protein n=1 Tax=Cupriavidus sp. SZY C1 TaxID=3055037 RepID=UPI0028B4B363|nr:alpha/beta fold hydrolase [Cupriavidus sp. SZY C1]MDT6963699.1 alpha/beta fold hydrolase [Cupriavidus sp. SZY C1]
MSVEKIEIPGSQGGTLAGRMEWPDGPVRAHALFAHCFTCGKDSLAASRIARALTAQGIAVLRFDFTGIGASEGDFASTNFSSNLADLEAVAQFMRARGQAPALLIGHSLGGAAVLGVARRLPEVRAVATIAAPSEPSHVLGLLGDNVTRIREAGELEVKLAGRPFRIARQFLDDLSGHALLDEVARLGKPLLVLQSPIDDTVEPENGSAIFAAAAQPKSFVSLDGADHLLQNRAAAAYAASMIAAWSQHYLPTLAEDVQAEIPEPGVVVVAERHRGRYQQTVRVGRHELVADEPATLGGDDAGPNPYEWLLAALGACTSMTLRMYAERKALPLEHVAVQLRHEKVHAEDCATCETKVGKVDRIERRIAIRGELTAEQRASLMAIADKCPVHRTLESEIIIDMQPG